MHVWFIKNVFLFKYFYISKIKNSSLDKSAEYVKTNEEIIKNKEKIDKLKSTQRKTRKKENICEFLFFVIHILFECLKVQFKIEKINMIQKRIIYSLCINTTTIKLASKN